MFLFHQTVKCQCKSHLFKRNMAQAHLSIMRKFGRLNIIHIYEKEHGQSEVGTLKITVTIFQCLDCHLQLSGLLDDRYLGIESTRHFTTRVVVKVSFQFPHKSIKKLFFFFSMPYCMCSGRFGSGFRKSLCKMLTLSWTKLICFEISISQFG